MARTSARIDDLEEGRLPPVCAMTGGVADGYVEIVSRIEQARLLLVTVPAAEVAQTIVSQVCRLNPALHIVARSEGVEQMKTLHDLGVHEVIQPEFEAGLEITRQALVHLDFPATEIQRFTDAVRHELYAPLYQAHAQYQTIEQLQNAARVMELRWVTLSAYSPLVGRSIRELNIRDRTGASVVGVMRAGELYPTPDAGYRFDAGDMVVVMGNAEQLEAFHNSNLLST